MSWRGGEGGGEVMVEEEMKVSVRVGRGERGVEMEVRGVDEVVEEG